MPSAATRAASPRETSVAPLLREERLREYFMPNSSHAQHRVRRGGRGNSGVITDGIYGRVRAYGPFGEGLVCDRTVRQSPATERKRALSELRQNALRQNAATEGVLSQAKSL